MEGHHANRPATTAESEGEVGAMIDLSPQLSVTDRFSELVLMWVYVAWSDVSYGAVFRLCMFRLY